MLKDLILTLGLLCGCFALMITLNNLAFSTQTNLLISSIFISWTILQFVGHHIYFHASYLLIMAILLMLQQFEEIFWAMTGMMAGFGIYTLLQGVVLPVLKEKLGRSFENSPWIVK
ncbi:MULTISPECIES: hypothetical protein [unclassified Acinetobacter]|uniref:hypothetical protein n=1 Tax=unclassified Acinetobacter TaxID=196816 RepID=UPI0007D07EBF|nr:hypothetical protein [Acinetobacter sp. SFA]OAL81075.1 hypothetical protein AY607_14310 [Acinetobacter sp. SFA]